MDRGSVVKQLIASKISFCLQNICLCTVYFIVYIYINTHTYSIYIHIINIHSTHTYYVNKLILDMNHLTGHVVAGSNGVWICFLQRCSFSLHKMLYVHFWVNYSFNIGPTLYKII